MIGRARLLGLVLLAGALPSVPATASNVVLTQHLAGEARAAAVRYDPRYAGNRTIEEVVPAHVEVSTVGLHDKDATARAWAASDGFAYPTGDEMGFGATAEQRAGATDNEAPVVAEMGIASASAHARRVDLASGVCPTAVDGERILATSTAENESPAELGDGLTALAGTSSSSLAIDEGTVVARAHAAVASVTLADAIELRIIGRADLWVRASGLPGGAEIFYLPPIVDVIEVATGRTIARLDADEPGFDLTPDETNFNGFNHAINLRLGVPHDVIVMDDGTYARAEADLVEVRMFDPSGSFEWQHIRIGSLAASATAPIGGVTTCDGGSAPSVDRSVPRVLVYELASGWEHTSQKQASLTIADIANQTDAFTLEFTRDPSFLRADKLAAFDAVYFNSTTGTFPWSAQQKELFLDYLTCNGGVIGTHAAADANQGSWPEWNEIIGASFEAHPHMGYFPVVGEATVQVEDQTSPITAPWHGVDTFRWAEEYYKFETDPRGTQDVEVLLSLDEDTVYPYHTYSPSFAVLGTYGPDQPLAWTKTFRGNGRVFYTAFGHNGFAWAQPDFREHVLQGLVWVTSLRPDPSCITG